LIEWTKVGETELGCELIERWALDYLGRYATSAEHLRRVLQRRIRRRVHEDPDAIRRAAPLIDAVIERQRCFGLLDDRSYAIQRAQALNYRGLSLAGIRARLIAKGISAVLAAEVLSTLQEGAADPELAAACALARRRRLGPYRTHGGDHACELAVFARAGFPRRVAEAVLACRDIEAIEALARDGLG
jgi:regulatory protein